jgi:hypothetical protein
MVNAGHPHLLDLQTHYHLGFRFEYRVKEERRRANGTQARNSYSVAAVLMR